MMDRHTSRAALTVTVLVIAAGSTRAAGPHEESNGIVCEDCHTPLATGFAARGQRQEATCKSCHNPTGRAAAVSHVARHVVNDGQSVIDCAACHDPHGPHETTDPHPGGLTAFNLKLIRSNTGKHVPPATEPAVFQSRPEHFAFGEDSPPWNGICQTCHTQTAHHTNGPDADHEHNLGRTCTGCHRHEDGFLPGHRTCTGCHSDPQGGRRQIVGPGGDFDQVSRHIAGSIADEDCTACHEMSEHQQGVVRLKDPDTGDVWTGDRTMWCLTCHDGDPPAGVAFPAEIGGRSDRSRFLGSPHHLQMQSGSCLHCHNAHGSPHPALLKDAYTLAEPNEAPADADDYALCWRCHDQTSILAGGNAFEGYHGTHVVEEGTPCFYCHDTHGAADADEPGLINFEYAVALGRDLTYSPGHDAGTAFLLMGDSGGCYLSCHGTDHDPLGYWRTPNNPTHCSPCHLSDGSFVHDPQRPYCSDCHADNRPALPHPQQADCSTCHYDPGVTWQGAAYSHDPVPSSCAPCHEGQRPASPHPQGTDCSSCHYDPGVTWQGATYSHDPVPSSCAPCHEGQRPALPHPQGTDCSSCHYDPGVTWQGATYNHDPVPSSCAPCHESQRPALPHPQGTDCSSCHYDPGVTWQGATYNHDPVPSSCAPCHESQRRPPPHPPVMDCSTCHSNPGGDWDGGRYRHDPPPTECAVCHEHDRPTSSEHNQSRDCVECHTRPGRDWDHDD